MAADDPKGIFADEKGIGASSASPSDDDSHSDPATQQHGHGHLAERRLSAAEWEKLGQTKRGLSPRHVQLMAIGGSIGTGLFVGIGNSLSTAGPLSLFLGYCFWGILFIWPCNLCVGEMLAYLPVRGTVFELASRYVDPALGFAMGWTYFFAGVMLVCVEYSAVATVMGYWSDVNPAAWIAMALVVCTLLNVVAVRWYGESEFIMASTKILLIIGLILLTFITMLGGNPRNDRYGFRYWTDGNAMHPYYTDGSTGRFLGFWSVVIYAAFTVGGRTYTPKHALPFTDIFFTADFVALAAGEIVNPRKTVPKVARLIFWRLVGFYILGVLAVGIICSSRDNRLIGALDSGAAGSAASPWVIGIQNLGISGLPDLINALILLSGWSCGNAYLYSSSRTLYGLARDSQAPKFFMKCTKAGVPVYAVLTVQLISCVTFLVASNNAVEVFYWFVGLTTCALVLTYVCMLWTYLGWHYAKRAQGIKDSDLPYVAPWNPYAAYFGIVIGCLVMVFIGFDTFVPWSTQGFITSYFGLAFGVVMFFFVEGGEEDEVCESGSGGSCQRKERD